MLSGTLKGRFMLKQFVCSLFFCAAAGHAGVIYTFTGTGTSVLGGPFSENFQYTAPGFLTAGSHTIPPTDLNYCSGCGFVNFNQSGDALGHLADQIIIADFPHSSTFVYIFPLGTFGTFGTYVLDQSTQNSVGSTGTLVVSDTPEPGSAGLMLLSLAAGALFLRRVKTAYVQKSGV